jgi:hemerythrin superfamily protein
MIATCRHAILMRAQEPIMPRTAIAKSAASEIIDLLEEDHNKVLALFAEFRQLRGSDNDEAKQSLVESACTELVIHAQVEEEYLYPALANALDDSESVEESEIEHTAIRQLIAAIESMQAGDARYDACFTVLGEYVEHHVAKERLHVFPAMQACTTDLRGLVQDIRHRRTELRSEFGMPDENYEEDRLEFGSGRSQRMQHH